MKRQYALLGILITVLGLMPVQALEVYFIRHGETTWNRARVLQGNLDYPDLSWKGCLMAEETGRGLKEAQITFDCAFVSPLQRARHTADLIFKGRGTPLQCDMRLREMGLGIYQGVRYDAATCRDANLRNFYENPARYVPQGKTAETPEQVTARIKDFIDAQLRPLDGKYTRIACVTHACVLTALTQLYGTPDQARGPKGVALRNCSTLILDVTPQHTRIMETGRIFYDAQKFDALHVPRLVAHRGAADLTMPEASRAAYSNAVMAASDIVKLDLQRTKDGIIVLSHDPTLTRTMGWNKKIADLTYDEIYAHGTYRAKGGFAHERIVRLDEALSIVRAVPEFWIDFKHFDPAFAAAVLKTFKEAGIDFSRIMVATFSRSALAYMQKHYPQIRRVAHTSGTVTAKAVRELKGKYDLYGVNLPQRTVTREVVREAKGMGLWVALWFVQNTSAARYWLGLGADAFVSDYAARVREVASAPNYTRIEEAIDASDKACTARQALLKDRVALTDYRSLVRAAGGTNIWTDALQAALNAHEIVTIPPAEAPYWIDTTVTIPSNRRIEAAGATMALLPGVRVLMLRNRNCVDGTERPITNARYDDNIAIVGGRWEDWMRKRAGYGQTGRFDAHTRRLGSWYGVSTLFYFGTCNHVSIKDVTFAHTSGFALQAGNGTAHLYQNITFDDCYADGLHLNGNLSCVHVHNVRGKVGDDLVALNAYDWLNSSVNFGPQKNMLCEDLALILKDGKGYPAIRILPAQYRYKDGTIVDCAISDVIFRRVTGIKTFKMYVQTPAYTLGQVPEWSAIGTGGNLWFDDLSVDLSGPIDGLPAYTSSDPVRGHFAAFEFGANLSTVDFRNVTLQFHLDKWPLAHLATVGPKSVLIGQKEIFDPYVNCQVDEVTVDGLTLKGQRPKELVHATVFDNINADGRSSGKGTIRRLNIYNVTQATH